MIARDRHGRGIRRPLPSKLWQFGSQRGEFFQQVVAETCDYLRDSWPDELGLLNWRIADLPVLDSRAEQVRRYRVDRDSLTITLYRLPIQRMRRVSGVDARMQIEKAVIMAVAELIDKDPWQLLHPGD